MHTAKANILSGVRLCDKPDKLDGDTKSNRQRCIKTGKKYKFYRFISNFY